MTTLVRNHGFGYSAVSGTTAVAGWEPPNVASLWVKV